MIPGPGSQCTITPRRWTDICPLPHLVLVEDLLPESFGGKDELNGFPNRAAAASDWLQTALVQDHRAVHALGQLQIVGGDQRSESQPVDEIV